MIRGVSLLLVLALAVALGLFVEGCPGRMVDQRVAIRAVETNSFTNPVILKRDVNFVCYKGGGRGDVVRFTVEATNPIGQRVKVYIYCGWPFKGATMRTP